MYFDTIEAAPLMTNCYLIGDEKAKACAVVDPGGSPEKVIAMIERSNMEIKMILLTHGHYDHIGAVDALLEKWPGLPVYIHPADLCPAESTRERYRMPDKGASQRTYGDGDAGGGRDARGGHPFCRLLRPVGPPRWRRGRPYGVPGPAGGPGGELQGLPRPRTCLPPGPGAGVQPVYAAGDEAMKLIFQGHDYRYAVEQSLLAFFPQERPVYEGEDPNVARVRLTAGKTYHTAVTELTVDGHSARGLSRLDVSGAADDYERERLLQRIVKLSFFKAARELTGRTPAWGALTGIRPAKLAESLLTEGLSPKGADRVLRDTYFVAPARRRLAIECAQAGIAAKEDLLPEDISLYVGIPFCPTRCAYCSFVSNSVEKSFHLVEPYLEALLAEVDSAAELVRDLGLRIKSFYMGGGTPTTLTAEQMDRLLGRLNDKFDMSHTVEYTVEAGRPDTITVEKLAALRRNGVTRVSINPQSMDDRVLAAIGRRHTADDIRRAMELVAAADFLHVNMDLIAGLPEDSPEGFRRSLDEVIAMGADDITVHTLSLKKGSRITLEGTRLPAVEEVAAMLDYADGTLRGAGFAPYYLYRQKYMSGSFENVGWCRPGGVGWYNIYIMEELHSILSLGAGGSTKMVDSARQRIERVFNLKYPQEYIQRPEKVRENQRAFRAFYENGGK